jgi:hypothetical protein
MKPRLDEFKRPMFDIKIDLDEISLNMSRDQVNISKTNQRFSFSSTFL